MKTRTLLLLALGCGVAIMLAGAVLLFNLTRQDDAGEPIPIGQEVPVGDLRVIVEQFDEVDGVLSVDVTLVGVDDPEAAAGFRLIASGRGVDLSEGVGCVATVDAPVGCLLLFDVSEADGEARTLFYDRGESGARWALA
jgi:hypothetical protein